MKGKEKQTVGELYDLFESVSRVEINILPTSLIGSFSFTFIFLQLASELWPELASAEADDEGSHNDPDDGEVEEDLEKQIAKELAVIKRPRREQRFGTSHTHCLHGPEVRLEWLIT